MKRDEPTVTTEEIESWVRTRNDHHSAVLSYFSDRPDDLLVVNFISNPLAAGKISTFIGFEDTAYRPHANKNSERFPEPVPLIESAAERMHLMPEDLAYDILCPSLLLSSSTKELPADTNMLEEYSAQKQV